MQKPVLAADAATFADSEWNSAADLDLRTAISLARASTQALMNLSPLAHREICDALADEVATLRRRGDERSLATARAVEQYLVRAA